MRKKMESKEELIEEKFLTMDKFSVGVETIVSEEQVNYIDAILYFCDRNNIEIETVPKLISKPLKEKLKWDAEQLCFIKKTSKGRLHLI